jgi:large subunit ribosomal protein L5
MQADDRHLKGQPKERSQTADGQSPRAARRVPRLLERYRAEIAPSLQKEFSYKNPMEIPKLSKVVLNVGLGEALVNSNALEAVTRMLAIISGQKAVTTKARKSIAGFKLREGNTIGAMVTLRSHRMYDFVDRLIYAALPRIRDFRGVSRTALDGRGSYSMGIREQVIFPEIDYNQIDKIRGLQVTLVTTAKTDPEALRLLEQLGMPFARVQETVRA